jgi:ubiquinone/menaquinone biosynthesis C-methylase UbiE
MAIEGRVYGVDFSEESVAASKRTNAGEIGVGRVEIRHGAVSQLPFEDGMFDLVTGVETHFWWPDLGGDMSEVFRVLKPRGTLVLIAEVYGGSTTKAGQLAEKYASRTGMKLLSVEEHRQLLEEAGFSDVRIVDERGKGWICAVGRKASAV